MKVLFAALPSQEKGASEDIRAQAYLYAIEDAALHVLDGVVRDILQGRVPDINLAFAPSPPQIAKLCRDRTDDMRGELMRRRAELSSHESKAALPPPVVLSEEEQAEHERRIEEKLEKVRRQLSAAVEHMDITPKRKTRAA